MAKKPLPQVEEDQSKFAPAGLKWLYEFEMINSSTLQNNLYGNLYAFPNVDDVELIIDQYQRKMLIYVKFTFFTRKFLKARRKELIIGMLDQLQELLPSFEFRITEDRAIFELALKRTQEVLFGGTSVQKPNESVKADVASPVDIVAAPSGPITDRKPIADPIQTVITAEEINRLPAVVATDPKKSS